MDLGLDLERTVVVVTGAGGQIGRVIVDAFLSAGCYVGAFDVDESKFTKQHDGDTILWVGVDVTDERAMRAAWQRVEDYFQRSPTVCVAAAALDLSFVERHQSIISMPTEQFRKTLDVNTTGTFITAKLWLLHLQKRMEDVAAKIKGGADSSNRPKQPRNISLIIIGSEAGVWGVPGNPDYAASKSAVQYGLMLSVAPDAARIHPRARVNAVCPGTVDTMRFQQECAEDPRDSLLWVESEATVASRKAVQSEEIARLCLYLASERWSASTTGQTWRIDGGKSGRLFWNRDGSPTWT